jgi:hypothetical protein
VIKKELKHGGKLDSSARKRRREEGKNIIKARKVLERCENAGRKKFLNISGAESSEVEK